MKNKFKGFLITALVVVALTGCNNNNAYQMVVKTSEELNKRCPMVIDAETRLDNTAALDNPVKLVYNYTLVNATKKELGDRLTSIKETMKPNIQNTVDTNPEMKPFRDNHVLLMYSYKDKNGEYLFDFTITPTNKTEE